MLIRDNNLIQDSKVLVCALYFELKVVCAKILPSFPRFQVVCANIFASFPRYEVVCAYIFE